MHVSGQCAAYTHPPGTAAARSFEKEAAPSLSENEVRFLRALLRRRVRFMVVGLSAAALQGAPVVTQDVDLWFEDLGDPRIREALQEVGVALLRRFAEWSC